ncbi:MAG: insulinase family protein [Myxococcales bacterium]|nr:insulinase family protein [Myxococcales bacterium]
MPLSRGCVAVALALLLGLPVAAAWAEPRPHQRLPAIAAHSFRLPGGLDVIISPDPSQPIVAMSVWYRVGCGDEAPDQSGRAHLLEHLMFAGSEHANEPAYAPRLAAIGATSIAGTTREDRTEYVAVVPAGALELALWLESDRMRFLAPRLTAKAVATNKEIIANELRLKLQHRAYGPSLRALHELMFPAGHPFRPTCFGYLRDIEGATLADIRAFYDKWYRPSNATLVLVGDVDVAKATALVTKYFRFDDAVAPHSPPPPRHTVRPPTPPTPPTPADARRIDIIDTSGEARIITLAWHGPGVGSETHRALTALASHMSSPRTSWLYRDLVRSGVATAVQASYAAFAASSLFKLELQLPDTTTAAAAEARATAVLARYRHEFVAPRELSWLLMETLLATIDALGSPLGRAGLLQASHMYFGDHDAWRAEFGQIAELSPTLLRDAAARVLTADAMYVVVTEPGG